MRREKTVATAALVVVTTFAFAGQSPPPSQGKDGSGANNTELEALSQADQSDRRPPAGKAIDWASVSVRDREREARVRELYVAGALKTGHDYFSAALVLQHSVAPDSHLLAHELSIVAITKGEPGAKWLAAAAEDRFLMEIGRPQRFGTQYRSDGPGSPMRLYDVDPAVTDELRREMNVPSLDEARRREASMKIR